VNLRVLFLVLAVMAAGCSSGSSDGKSADSSTSTAPAETTATSTSFTEPSTTSTVAATVTTGTTAKPVTTTLKPAPGTRLAASGAFIVGPGGAAVATAPGGPVLRRLRAGVIMAVDAVDGGWAHVLTPCENSLWAKTAEGRIDQTADIVLDPGHGGGESGAVGPGGLTEKELNLAVAQMTVEALAAEGVHATLARTGDYRQSLASRVAVATALHPKAFVSIHHNAAPDEAWPKPGTETYYQNGKSVPADRLAASKRLAGLIYEEVVKALSGFSASWVADRDAGAKYRLGDSGDDYYGILRRSAANGVVASLAELAFVTNPSEEALLRTDAVRRAEANAVARGIVRFLRSEDPGSGFVVPYPRTEPAGGGGGTEGCTDPV
jgi:N-acetylmuramoyl-L-alanine amidase